MNKFLILFFGALLSSAGNAQMQHQHGGMNMPGMQVVGQIHLSLQTPKMVSPGEQDISLSATFSKGNPVIGLTGTAELSMPSMSGMMLETPTIMPSETPGIYKVHAKFPHPGDYKLMLHLQTPTGTKADTSFMIHVQGEMGGGMEHMHGMNMKGALGNWTMNREGSGTAWQPDDSPMFMVMLPNIGRYELNAMGEMQAGYVDAGGKRGDKQIFTNSMGMLMARRETGGGTFGANLMMSLDPVINGKRGVPNLFQTGETNNGQPLVDRQHPHDLLSEASVSYARPLGNNLGGFIYLAPIGEPALGNVMFMHRASGMEVPEAPISHHWFDSTHISFGVATLGLTVQDKWKVEASAFNGHEPDENRFDIDPIQFNSASGRVSFNPSSELSFSASYGFLKSPEALEPGVDQHRLTASVAYAHNLANGDNFSATTYFGKLIVPGRSDSNAWLVEGTLYHRTDSIFGRFERVDKDELVGVPVGTYTINKLLFGDVHNFASPHGMDIGLGAYIGLYSFPSSLKPYYGSNPVTWGVFLRVRPSRM